MNLRMPANSRDIRKQNKKRAEKTRAGSNGCGPRGDFLVGDAIGARGSGLVVVIPGACMWNRFVTLACRKAVVGFVVCAHIQKRGYLTPAVTSETPRLASPTACRVLVDLGSPRMVVLLHAF